MSPPAAMRTSVIIAVLALAACAAATRNPWPNNRKCKTVVCDTAEEYFEANCQDFQVVRKAFKAGAEAAPGRDDEPLYGKCCDTFVCVQDPNNPCGGKTENCPALSLGEANANCNNLYPEDPIWTEIQPNFGAMYAVLKEPAKNVEGRCCDKYVCRTDHVKLCENLVKKTPCANAATCPLGHYAEVVEQADPENGKCCNEIRCVADPDRLCALANEETECPVPNCAENYEELQLQTIVTLFAADPYSGRCCPQYTCQNNLPAICEAERRERNWPETYSELCSECEDVNIIEAEEPELGRCFPKYECVPKANAVCCGFDYNECPAEPTELGSCEYAVIVEVANDAFGPCCDVWKVFTNSTCLCEAQLAIQPCPYEDADDFFLSKCFFMNIGNHLAYDAVVVNEADPAAGRCCPTYKCKPTAEEMLKRQRIKKGPKVKSSTVIA